MYIKNPAIRCPMFNRPLCFFRLFKPFLPIVAFVLVFTSCENSSALENRGQLLAEVDGRKLYEKDIEYIFRGFGPTHDSTSIVKNYIENWVRDQAFVKEAENNLGEEPLIARKVESYRNSLIRHEFETRIVNERLDTAITESELNSFYQSNQDQFVSPYTLIKVRIAGFPSDNSQVWRIRNQFYEEYANAEDLQDLVVTNQGQWLLHPNRWYTLSELNTALNNPISRENIIPGYELSFVRGDKRFFGKVVSVVNEGELTPRELVEGKIRQLIVLNRRNRLIAGLRNEIYEREIRNNNVKIYFQ